VPYYDDDGNEIDPATIPIPQMCIICDRKDLPEEEILCNLNRMDQIGEAEFKCGAFLSIYGALIDDIIK
jgi:hypothetical protein